MMMIVVVGLYGTTITDYLSNLWCNARIYRLSSLCFLLTVAEKLVTSCLGIIQCFSWFLWWCGFSFHYQLYLKQFQFNLNYFKVFFLCT